MDLRPLRWLAALAVVATSLLAAPVSAAARLAEVSIHDRRDGRELPIHWSQGRRYVVGEPGRQYEIRVRNRSGGRVLAVTSVDGVNVLSGETASAAQSGYVIDGHDHVRIDGWRKSLAEVAAFTFTRLPDSYAARTGRPGDVGVIGIALFREKAHVPPPAPPSCCWPPARRELEDSASSSSSDADAAAAPQAEERKNAAERLGTGHGERLDSAAQHVAFERATDTPDDVIAIWYDTRANLVAQGVLPRAPRRPDPFPAWEPGFVPDP